MCHALQPSSAQASLCVQINYFPSRLDPVRHSERFPENRLPLSGPRERRMLEKENNFQQARLRLSRVTSCPELTAGAVTHLLLCSRYHTSAAGQSEALSLLSLLVHAPACLCLLLVLDAGLLTHCAPAAG